MNIIIGILSGICASMGLGGGFILLLYLSVFTDADASAAAGANLMFFLAAAVPALIIHFKNHLIKARQALMYAAVGAVGAALGSLLSGSIDNGMMRKLLAGVFILFGIKEVVSCIKNRKNKQRNKMAA